MRRTLSILTALCLLLFAGCQNDEATTGQPTTAKTEPHQVVKPQPRSEPAPSLADPGTMLFEEAVDPQICELASFALPAWRQAGDEKPVLALFSIHPLLEAIAEPMQDRVRTLAATGTAEQLVEHGSFYRADPVILPTQAVSAALDAGLLSELVWVYPSTATPENMDLALFRKQVTEAGFLTEEEGAALNLSNGVFTGTVRGVPFRAVHPKALPALDRPFVLHVDLGFFKGLYINEVKTPLYNTILDTALAMAEAEWAPQVVTLSYSTIEGAISHDVRFLMSAFITMLRDPAVINQMPDSWKTRQEAMYSKEFFLDTKARELTVQNAEQHPGDASAQYDLYLQHFNAREIEPALAQLDKAVALDPGYGAAYLELAEVAQTDGNLPVTLELLDKGAPLFPHNPFIDLYRAQFRIELGMTSDALPLLDRLQALPWSTHFHPGIPATLDNMIALAKENP